VVIVSLPAVVVKVGAVGPADVPDPVAVVVISPPSIVVGPVLAVPELPAVVVVEGTKVGENDAEITGAVSTFNI
jgi:hypothetical protein